MLLKEARDGFLFDCECRHLAKGSIRNYRAETKFLMEFLELKQITEVEDVKAHHIRDFMKQKQDSGNTACYVNDILKACKTWFNYLVEEDYIEERRNPAAKVKYLKQPKTIIETFSTQEVKELIHYYSGCDYLEVRNKTIITLLFDTGMRCNEMIMMEPEDIKKDYIVVKHGKGNKERVVPKSPMLSKQLVRYLYVRENYFEGKSNKKNLFLSKTGKPLTEEQNLDRQIIDLKKAGVDERYIYFDKASGKNFNRRSWNTLVGTLDTAPVLREGDLLVVSSLDRMGRNYTEIQEQWQYITHELKADIRVIDMPMLDTSKNTENLDRRFIADLVLQILSYTAQKERENIHKRQEMGIAAAQSKGVKFGRPKAQYPAEWKVTYKAWKDGQITATAAMEKMGIKRTTFYKLVKRYEQKED